MLCLMPLDESGRHPSSGPGWYGVDDWEPFVALPEVDVFSTDPYWIHRHGGDWEYFEQNTQKAIDLSRRYQKPCQIWVQSIWIPPNREPDVKRSLLAAAEMGADMLAVWSFLGEPGGTAYDRGGDPALGMANGGRGVSGTCRRKVAMAVAQPNILLITTDQQRYDASGGAGPSFLRTPHYDRLRYEGVEFTSGYTDDPVCVPSRMGIMTGKQVFSHGMTGNGITSKILGREGTLPWYLRELGYQTIAIGKMHFGPERAYGTVSTRWSFLMTTIARCAIRAMTSSRCGTGSARTNSIPVWPPCRKP